MNAAIARELDFPLPGQKPVDVGSLPAPIAKRVQEWLSLHGYGLVIVGEPGPATRAALGRFQSRVGVGDDVGYLGLATWQQLVAPMARAFVIPRAADPNGRARTLRELVKMLAGQHLAQCPQEVGGDNRGPWVRAYTGGHDGKAWKWCAGFVCTVIAQAAQAAGKAAPLPFTLSCDELMTAAGKVGRLIDRSKIQGGDVFLCVNGDDAFHTGLVTKGAAEYFGTVEGNSNDDGSANGHEVCGRSRGYANKVFISLA